MTEKLTIRRIADVKINPAMIRERDHGLLTENILYCVAVMVLSTKRQHLPETNDEKPSIGIKCIKRYGSSYSKAD